MKKRSRVVFHNGEEFKNGEEIEEKSLDRFDELASLVNKHNKKYHYLIDLINAHKVGFSVELEKVYQQLAGRHFLNLLDHFPNYCLELIQIAGLVRFQTKILTVNYSLIVAQKN